jgi:uncharacterized membrane protein
MQFGDFSLAEDVADLIELVAVIVIAVGVLLAIIVGIRTSIQIDVDAGFDKFRRVMARGLLTGLDLLIAADIIKTVTLEPTLENVSALGLLVLIRTFLTWTLLVETEGHWPWQQDKSPTKDS